MSNDRSYYTIIAAENVIGTGFSYVLTGDSGANLLAGLGGNDVLDGAGGNDAVRFNSITETLPGAPRDVIIDFSRVQGDKIHVSGIDARVDLAGNQAFSFIGTAAFTGIDGQLRQGGNVIPVGQTARHFNLFERRGFSVGA